MVQQRGQAEIFHQAAEVFRPSPSIVFSKVNLGALVNPAGTA
jgi:hypothetical protein